MGPRGYMDVLFDSTTATRRRVPVILETIVGVTFFGLLPVYAMITPFKTDPLEWVVFGLWGTVGLLCLGLGIMKLFAHERLVMDGDQVRSVRWLGRLRRGWEEPLEAIQEVEVYSIGPNLRGGGWGPGMPAVRIRTQERRRVCCFGMYPMEAEAVVAQIRFRLEQVRSAAKEQDPIRAHREEVERSARAEAARRRASMVEYSVLALVVLLVAVLLGVRYW
jgi:hypothetical protein